MSDFDEVLERLLGDPAFKARLATDPAGALAGYQLTPDELDILRSQVGDAGGQSHVEQRTSKASMFGVFSSIGSGLGDLIPGHGQGHGHGGSAAGHQMHEVVEQQYGGRHAAAEPAGSGPIGHQLEEMAQGGRHASASLEEVHTSASLEEVHTSAHLEEVHTESHYESRTEHHSESRSSGTVYRSGTYAGATGGTPQEPGSGGGIGAGLAGVGQGGQPAGHGAAGPAGGLAGLAQQAGHAQVPGAAPTDGYHTRVDWDGDGRWDQHTYVNRADGGVDIVVDTDGDGRAEFVGHDTDRDGLINSSEIDTNHDGVVDARYEDVNGDGWLDRRTR
jgi:hypothetical protein